MKTLIAIASIILFTLCLFITSAAQQQFVGRDYGPEATYQSGVDFETKTAFENRKIAPFFITIARVTKYLYTGDATFSFEKKDTIHDHPRHN